MGPQVAEHVGTKTKAMCRTHYLATYVNVPTAPLPDMSRIGAPLPPVSADPPPAQPAVEARPAGEAGEAGEFQPASDRTFQPSATGEYGPA